MTSDNQLTPFLLTSNIGPTINYLDVEIGHIDGFLQTKVFHDCPYEPFSLPYITDHPPYMYLTLIRTALLRIVRCCTNYRDYVKETHFLQLSLSINNFPLNYVTRCFDLFYQEFFSTTVFDRYRQHAYDKLRGYVQDYDQRCQATLIQQRQDAPTLASTNFKKTLKRRWENQSQQTAIRKRSKRVIVNEPNSKA
jgi:hypothetical protein